MNASKIVDGSITTADLGDAQVTKLKLAGDSVDSTKIVNGSIGTADLGDAEITFEKLAGGSVRGGADTGPNNIQDGSITEDDLSPTAISNNLGAGSLDGAKLKNESVKGDGAGSGPKGQIALDTIGSANILDGQVKSADLDHTAGTEAVDSGAIRNGAVTSAKILDGTITGADIAGTTITADNLADGAVTTAKILDGTITSADLQSTTGGPGAVATVNLQDDAVTAPKIAADAVGASEIATGAVTTAEIADGTIKTEDLLDGAVTTDKQTANAASASVPPATLVLNSGTLSGTPATASLVLTAGSHKVLVTGQTVATCTCPNPGDSAVIIWRATDTDSVPATTQVGPLSTITLTNAAPSAVLPVSGLAVLPSATVGAHQYSLEVTAAFNGATAVDLVGSGITAVDLGR